MKKDILAGNKHTRTSKQYSLRKKILSGRRGEHENALADVTTTTVILWEYVGRDQKWRPPSKAFDGRPPASRDRSK